jgi:hypothetical protein
VHRHRAKTRQQTDSLCHLKRQGIRSNITLTDNSVPTPAWYGTQGVWTARPPPPRTHTHPRTHHPHTYTHAHVHARDARRWFWPENGLVFNDSLFIFTPVLTSPCTIGCKMVGVSLITVHNPADPPLDWTYDTDEVGAQYFDSGITWPTSLVRDSTTDGACTLSGHDRLDSQVPVARLTGH